MNKTSTVDRLEVAKFAQHASHWWDKDGPLKTLHDINPIRLEFVQRYTELMGAQVLDVGCGGGILSEAMALKGALVTGLDVEEATIATATDHAKEHRLKIKYLCQPIEDYHTHSFDVITCMEMLEHVSEPKMVVEHCARLLKTGGYLFLSTINRTLHAYAQMILAAEYIFGLLPRQTHDYKKFIKPSELAAMVRAAGLETIGMSGMTYHPFLREASLDKGVQVNYLLACRKSSKD
jgi:2-polyprenyl-6-hydroxyphenyl methylase/3-demethylubiquinone-9 3-methyltransferase